jgi:hypothetical protein
VFIRIWVLGGKEGCASHNVGGWNRYEEAGGNSSWNPTISFSSTEQGEPDCVQGKLYLQKTQKYHKMQWRGKGQLTRRNQGSVGEAVMMVYGGL